MMSGMTLLPEEELRAELRSALFASSGSPKAAAHHIGVSLSNFWYLLRRAGIREEPGKISAMLKKRYRLPAA